MKPLEGLSREQQLMVAGGFLKGLIVGLQSCRTADAPAALYAVFGSPQFLDNFLTDGRVDNPLSLVGMQTVAEEMGLGEPFEKSISRVQSALAKPPIRSK